MPPHSFNESPMICRKRGKSCAVPQTCRDGARNDVVRAMVQRTVALSGGHDTVAIPGATLDDRLQASETPMDPQDPAQHSHDVAALVHASGLGAGSFWQEVVDTMNEGLLLVGPDRRIVYINKKGEELVGRTLQEVRGSLCVDAISCPQCKCCCRTFEEGRAENVEVTIFAHNDGRRRVLLKNSRLLHGPAGELLGGVETFTDITKEVKERQENERYTSMLFQEKTRVDALLGAMDEGVFSIDGGLVVQSCSQRMAELLGLDDGARAVGKRLVELVGAGRAFDSISSAVELDGKSLRVELPAVRGRKARPAELSFRRVRLADDEMLGLLRVMDRQRDGRGCAEGPQSFHGIISRAPEMMEIFRLIEGAAQTHANILIEGESGVGKELVARAIHQLSPRRDEPFYAVNCATFAGSLLLSELFGHERGSFTGAFRTAKGKLELAGAGTLFLDEVAEIPLHYQAVLLRVLEERVFERVGGHQKLEMRARIVAATNERLADAVQARRFREDLYFRLKVVPIRVPPLRQRRGDIPLLATYFANHPAVNLSGKPVRVTDEAMALLTAYSWPGNVRELRNLVEYLCFVAGDVIDVVHLPPEMRTTGVPSPVRAHSDRALAPSTQAERDAVVAALHQARFNKQEAARLLGVDRSTLWRRMKRLGIR